MKHYMAVWSVSGAGGGGKQGRVKKKKVLANDATGKSFQHKHTHKKVWSGKLKSVKLDTKICC
jgi:hypothetical protein